MSNESPQSTFDFDKVIKPVTRSAESLKRMKEPGLKGELKNVDKLVKNVESAADAVANFKSIGDAKAYEKKVGLVKELLDHCEGASKAINDLLGKEVHSAGSPRKGRSIEVKSALPGNVTKPTVLNVPGLGAQLSELQGHLDAAVKETKSVYKDLTSWLKTGLKDGKLPVKIPRDVTNMIELVDSKGRIGLPSDQSFDVTITFTIEKAFQPDLKVFGKELEEEITKALLPSKQEVAQKFRAWNSQFAKIEKEFDRDKAEDLFKTINKHFDSDIRKKIEDDLKAAAQKALKDSLSSKFNDSVAKKADIDVKADFSNFAEFKINFPDNPADDVAKSTLKSFDSMAAAQKGYNEAVTGIVDNYTSLGASMEELQKELQAGARKTGDAQPKFDPTERLKGIKVAASGLETALKDGTSGYDALANYLAPVNKKIEDSKGALKDNVTVDNKDIDKLSGELKEALKQLKGPIPGHFKELSKSVAEARDIEKSLAALGGGGKSPPTAEDLAKALREVKKASAAFATKKAELQKSLTITADVDKLKALAEKLKS